MSKKKGNKKRRKNKGQGLTYIIFLIGFGLCLFPLISSAFMDWEYQGVVTTYKSDISLTSEEDLEKMVEDAREYNNMLLQSKGASVSTLDLGVLSDENYNSLLNMSGTGIMGHIEIPKISVDLPIYHGTSDEVLSNGVGHLQSSALPIGGKGLRPVLTGHRGLPSSKLFTRLDEIVEGDFFFIKIGNGTLAYEVCDIEVIKPSEVDKLEPEPDKDLVTLVTCTPYGLNTHRLLVTGERTKYVEGMEDDILPGIPSIRELAFMILPFVFLIVLVIIIKVNMKNRKKRRKERK